MTAIAMLTAHLLKYTFINVLVVKTSVKHQSSTNGLRSSQARLYCRNLLSGFFITRGRHDGLVQLYQTDSTPYNGKYF